MSTKSSIKWKDHTEEGPGYHLYDDCLDFVGEGQEPPVYLRLDGVPVELVTLHDVAGASVTVELPRSLARELGLLPSNALAQASCAGAVEETTCGCTASPGAEGSAAFSEKG